MEYTTDEIVILVDVAYLDKEAGALSDFFSTEVLKRPLAKADMALFLEGVSMDAKVPMGKTKVQVIFVYDKQYPQMKNFIPSGLEKELNNVGFDNEIGEFSLAAYPNEEMVAVDALYAEMMNILSVSKGTQKLLLITDLNKYTKESWKSLSEAADREIYFYTMNPEDAKSYPFVHNQLGYPLLNALGIRSDEFSDK